MAKTVTVKPAPGLLVRMPGSPPRTLSESGTEVVLDEYWRNRLRDGDVVEVTATPAPAASKKKEA